MGATKTGVDDDGAVDEGRVREGKPREPVLEVCLGKGIDWVDVTFAKRVDADAGRVERDVVVVEALLVTVPA